MKAAKLTEHPSFRLMRQTDVQNVWHMQMPRWLFSDLRYADMSLDAKVTYTFLLNISQAGGASAYLGKALRARRRQPDLSGQRHAHRRSQLRMRAVLL